MIAGRRKKMLTMNHLRVGRPKTSKHPDNVSRPIREQSRRFSQKLPSLLYVLLIIIITIFIRRSTIRPE